MVAGANGRERRRAAPLFAQAFRQELVIPMAQGFQFLRPDGQHARRLAKLFGHQVVDCRVLERGVMFERLLEETARHHRGAEQQGAHVETHHRRRQQTRGREDGEAAADVVRDREDLLVGEAVGQA